jgi:hypothetical protein
MPNCSASVTALSGGNPKEQTAMPSIAAFVVPADTSAFRLASARKESSVRSVCFA